ncbi:hypothetical protein FRACYDRAFT_244354 [Fragilariopsis cylindrus CCMP1102]|uniref:Uncharacterized protein n=1 Tax=Fragilariopsis cylindrus CCMP1102 TaxID=635003 RepID=A0A1E7F1W6_9STRA|nr:hypothetical protein FRACYDRAFT_244354 [Fragilariopsis cylindrus CCMP1102]|eukprot:OEU12094.1 hypothetical protein FRACYDRAFT_244354 [Fragilariopsis cylindrus CCMP1102]
MSTETDNDNNNNDMSSSCTIKDFIYYDINGNVVEGTKSELFPSSSSSSSSLYGTNNENEDEDSDSSFTSRTTTCIFDTANCHPSSLPHECCTYNKESINEQSSWSTQYMILCVLIPILYIKTSIKEKEKKKSKNGSTENENEADDNEDKEVIDGSTKIIPWYIAQIQSKLPIRSLLIWIWSKGFLSFMMLTVPASIALRNSYQTNLSVSNRNLMIAADAFMVPYQTIFYFIEDIILVQIGYALGRNDKIKTNQLIHTGIAGSIVTGIIAGLIGTVLGLVPTLFQSLTNPGLHHDQLLYKGCEFFGNDISESESKTATAHAAVLPYWMMKSWSMIFQQIGMVMSGFFFGSKATMEIGWIMTISLSLNLYIWFTYVDTSSNPLTLIGIADYVYDFTIPLLTILYLITPLGSQICNRTGVHLSFTKLLSIFLQFKPSKTASSASSASSASTSVNETTKLIKDVNETTKKKNNEESSSSTPMSTSTIDLLLDGLKVMFMDVAIQGCVSFTLYVALLEDSAVAYQISALQSALPAYGYGYALGISMMFKLIGSTLLAQNKYIKFVQFATICVLCVLLLIPGIVISVVKDRHEIALVYGSNACVYASNEQCVNFFIEIFGINGDGISSGDGDGGDGDGDSSDRGNYTLQYTMTALAFGSIIDSISLVLRSILLSLLDFDFLVKSTICAVIFAYIPAMYVATYGAGVYDEFQRTAFAWYIAMNIPQLFLIFAFLLRLYYNFKRLLNNDDGPWMMEMDAVDDDDGNRSSSSSDALTLDRTSTTATKEKQRSYRSELTPLLLSQRRRSSASA